MGTLNWRGEGGARKELVTVSRQRPDNIVEVWWAWGTRGAGIWRWVYNIGGAENGGRER